MRRLVPLLLALAAALPPLVRAEHTAEFRLTVDHAVLASALRTELGLTEGGEAVLWGDPQECRALVADDLRIEPVDERTIRIAVRGRAELGFGIFGFCFAPARWSGWLETTGRPEVGRDWQLRLEDLESAAVGPDRQRTAIASRVWDLVRGEIETRLGAFRFDLAPPVAEARALVRASAPSARATPIVAALDSLRATGTIVDDDGVQVAVTIDVPEAPPGPSAAEPPLHGDELIAWQEGLERWDAFLLFVVKDLAPLDTDRDVRDDLLALLLESRHALLDALATQPQHGTDPVRKLFLDAWAQLRAIVRRVAKNGGLQDHALRYATFLAAGDALAALDAAGPGLGLEISADGLRRLARLLAPDLAADPLAYTDAPDPALRTLFGFHDPADTPPEEPAPPTTSTTLPAPATRWWLAPFAPRAAHAAMAQDDLAALGRRLHRWVPAADQLADYRDLVDRLFGLVADREGGDVGTRFGAMYRHLVRTTAWQESCWRQYVESDGQITFLYSASGDIGIMQVNRRVWRGFFDVDKLKWDIVYNAGAGAEILAQLLVRVGAREAQEQIENAARATYCAYNGGPSAFRRYRQARVPRKLRAIDEMFWEKYRTVAAGRAGDAVLCM